MIDPDTGIDREPFVRNIADAHTSLLDARRSLEAAGLNVSAGTHLAVALTMVLRGVEATAASASSLLHHLIRNT
jgi:hypothetical protein